MIGTVAPMAIVATTAAFALLFVQAAFNTLVWIRPSSVGQIFSLYALSTFNFLAFVILLMVLVRNIIKLRRERQAGKSGARFKQRLVFYSVALSLLPVTFLFIGAYGFLNRSLDKWFGLPADKLMTSAFYIQSQYLKGEREGLERTAATVSRVLQHAPPERLVETLKLEATTQQLEVEQLYDRDARLDRKSTRLNSSHRT